MLIVIGKAQAAPGRRQGLVEAATAMASATTSDEGCRSYGFYADLTQPDALLSIEVWADAGTLEAHMSHSHTQQFLAAVPDLVVGTPTMQFFRAEPTQESTR